MPYQISQLHYLLTRYGAEDAIGHLLCFLKLNDLPDLTRRLSNGNIKATPGSKVDIVPRNGSILSMASRAAVGIIREDATVESPDGVNPKSSRPGDGTVLVEIEKVLSPALLLQGKTCLFSLLKLEYIN